MNDNFENDSDRQELDERLRWQLRALRTDVVDASSVYVRTVPGGAAYFFFELAAANATVAPPSRRSGTNIGVAMMSLA